MSWPQIMQMPDQVTVSEAIVLAGQLALDDTSHYWAGLVGGPQFIGWTNDRAIAASTRDVLVAIATGLGGHKVIDADLWPRPQPDAEKPTTIADFDTGAFMRMLAT